MEDQSWQDLEARFERLREKDKDQLQAEFSSRDGISLQWELQGSDDAAHDDFIALAERCAQKAECGSTWQDWIESLRQQKRAFRPSAAEILYGRLHLSTEERAKFVRRGIAAALYAGNGQLPKKERAKIVRKHMASIAVIPGPEGYISRICQKSAIYCGRQAVSTSDISKCKVTALLSTNGSPMLESESQAEDASAETESQPSDCIIINGSIAVITFKGHQLAPLNGQLKSIKRLARLLEFGERNFDNPLELEAALDGITVSNLPGATNQCISRDPAAMDLNFPGSAIEDQESVAKNRRNIIERLRNLRKEIEEYDSLIAGTGGHQERKMLEAEKENLLEEQTTLLKVTRNLTVQSKRVSDYDPGTKKVLNKLRNSLFHGIEQISRTPQGEEFANYLNRAMLPFQFPFRYHPPYPVNWTIQINSTI
jgi:hypothetical protein